MNKRARNVLLAIGVLAAIVGVSWWFFVQRDPSFAAEDFLHANPKIAASVGKIVRVDWGTIGLTRSPNNSIQTAGLDVAVHGERGEGAVYLTLRKEDGWFKHWTVTSAQYRPIGGDDARPQQLVSAP